MSTVLITIREDLAGDERDVLARRLRATPGIRDVLFDPQRAHELAVEYDTSKLNESTLLEAVYQCGVYPVPAMANREHEQRAALGAFF